MVEGIKGLLGFDPMEQERQRAEDAIEVCNAYRNEYIKIVGGHGILDTIAMKLYIKWITKMFAALVTAESEEKFEKLKRRFINMHLKFVEAGVIG